MVFKIPTVFKSTVVPSESLEFQSGTRNFIPVSDLFREQVLPRCTAMFTLTAGEWTCVLYWVRGWLKEDPLEPWAVALFTNGGEHFLKGRVLLADIKSACYQSMMDGGTKSEIAEMCYDLTDEAILDKPLAVDGEFPGIWYAVV